MEFGGFIGGFGKIFFTNGGIKRGFGVFLGWREERGGRSYIFLKFFEGWKMNLKFCGGMYFGDYGVGRRRDIIWNIP